MTTYHISVLEESGGVDVEKGERDVNVMEKNMKMIKNKLGFTMLHFGWV